MGEIPFILLINKKDLIESWTIDQLTLKQLENDGWYILKTSAKDSENVEDAYQALAQQLLESL